VRYWKNAIKPMDPNRTNAPKLATNQMASDRDLVGFGRFLSMADIGLKMMMLAGIVEF
jgi:hypothetical protein